MIINPYESPQSFEAPPIKPAAPVRPVWLDTLFLVLTAIGVVVSVPILLGIATFIAMYLVGALSGSASSLS